MELFGKDNKHTTAGNVATVGFFDGVHRGHRFLLGHLVNEAKLRGMTSIAVTFADSPQRVLRPDSESFLLNTSEEKVSHILDAGIDSVAMLDFDRQLADMSAEDFMAVILKKQLNVKSLIMGYDHRFGKGVKLTFDQYREIGKSIDIDVIQSTPLSMSVSSDSQNISSSLIRNALQSGSLDLANDALGYAYTLSGSVVSGFHKGRELGYPTANLSVSPRKLIPADGAYAVRISLGDGRQAIGMLNIGCRPTMENGNDKSIEVHIFDFDEDIYNQHIDVSLIKFLRHEVKFSSLHQLKSQLAEDEAICKKIL